MTDRLLAQGLWGLGIATVVIVAFAAVTTLMGADPLGTTLPREGWVAALIGWGIVGGAAILGIGRAASDGWPARAPIGLVILLCAVAAGVAVEVTVMRWAAARFGVQAADTDLIGWASVLSPMVVLAGQAALASTVLSGAGRTAAQGITVVVSAGVLISVASNVPGAANGITQLGIPMGIAMAAGALVAIGAVWTVVAGRRGAQLPER